MKLFSSITPLERVEEALISLKEGRGVVIIDSETRENEGDIVFPAETITVAQMAMTIRYGSGIVCLCLTEHRRHKLELPMMVKNNTSKFGTRFMVTIEAAKGVTTGVSASDRITTIRAAIANNAKPSDLNRPGHIFPLCAENGGVLTRQGHTEATIDLVSLAGFKPAGILCELTNRDGSMSRLQECVHFARTKNMALITTRDLITYRQKLRKKIAYY